MRSASRPYRVRGGLAVRCAHIRGEKICGGDAMDMLGVERYGQLLDALAEHGSDRPDAHLTADVTPLLKEILK